MLDMWNYIYDLHKEGALSVEDMKNVLFDDDAAMKLWEDWAHPSYSFIRTVRSEVRAFLRYVEKKEGDKLSPPSNE